MQVVFQSFLGVYQRCVAYLINFEILPNISLGYVFISAFILGLIIDYLLLKA